MIQVMMMNNEPMEDDDIMYKCKICEETHKPYKNFEDLFLGMNAHFIRHHPTLHKDMMQHVELMVEGDWVNPEGTEAKKITDDVDDKGIEKLKEILKKKEEPVDEIPIEEQDTNKPELKPGEAVGTDE